LTNGALQGNGERAATLTIYDPPADIKRHAWLLLTAKLQDVKCLPLLSSATSEAFLLAVFQPLKPFSPSLAHSPFPLMKRLIKVM